MGDKEKKRANKGAKGKRKANNTIWHQRKKSRALSEMPNGRETYKRERGEEEGDQIGSTSVATDTDDLDKGVIKLNPPPNLGGAELLRRAVHKLNQYIEFPSEEEIHSQFYSAPISENASVDCYIFWPQDNVDKLNTIFYIPGSGAQAISPAHEFPVCAHMALAFGCRVVLICHSLAPTSRYPATYDEIAACINHFATQKPFAINVPAISGYSCGASIATRFCTYPIEQGIAPPFAQLISIAAPVDLHALTKIKDSDLNIVSKEQWDKMLPEERIAKKANQMGASAYRKFAEEFASSSISRESPAISPFYYYNGSRVLGKMPPVVNIIGGLDPIKESNDKFMRNLRQARQFANPGREDIDEIDLYHVDPSICHVIGWQSVAHFYDESVRAKVKANFDAVSNVEFQLLELINETPDSRRDDDESARFRHHRDEQRPEENVDRYTTTGSAVVHDDAFALEIKLTGPEADIKPGAAAFFNKLVSHRQQAQGRQPVNVQATRGLELFRGSTEVTFHHDAERTQSSPTNVATRPEEVSTGEKKSLEIGR